MGAIFIIIGIILIFKSIARLIGGIIRLTIDWFPMGNLGMTRPLYTNPRERKDYHSYLRKRIKQSILFFILGCLCFIKGISYVF